MISKKNDLNIHSISFLWGLEAQALPPRRAHSVAVAGGPARRCRTRRRTSTVAEQLEPRGGKLWLDGSRNWEMSEIVLVNEKNIDTLETIRNMKNDFKGEAF